MIRVAENPTTGYQWAVAGVTGPLDLESTDLVLTQGMAPGAAAGRRVVFRARQIGGAAVTLGLQRPWEVGKPQRRCSA